jgi:tetratricopeptide (TPR) repeat protein
MGAGGAGAAAVAAFDVNVAKAFSPRLHCLRMKRCAILLAALLASLLLVRAEGPDDMYVRIYYAIQEADNLNDKGDARQAVAKYMEAQSALRSLKTLHPEWNEKVVNFRLNYIASKLDPLLQKVPAPATPPTAVPAAPAPSPTPATQPAPEASPLKALQDEIARLTGQNALLEAKLKEAWSVQPPASDPRELTKAQQRVQELEKERDLLRVSIEQEKAKWTNAVGSTVISQERQILAEVKQKLAQQEQLTASLQKENQDLKQQNLELKSSADVLRQQTQALTQQVAELTLKLQTPAAAPAPASPLSADQTVVAALQSSNIALRTELLLTESRLADVSREVVRARSPKDQRTERELATAKSAVKELERERTKLKKQMDRLAKELAKRGGPAVLPPVDESERQLEIARARLEAYEAKAVPYTAEELALFKQRDLKVSPAEPGVTKKKVNELPAGAGPLIAEAERAVDSGRYDDAEKKYLQVLAQDEKNIYTLAHLAAVQLDQDRLADAEKTVQRALAVDPQDPASLYLMGSLRFRQQRYDEALDALSLSAQNSPDKPQAQYYLGRALIAKGQRQAAEAALRKAIQLKPNWGEPHYQLSVIYATQQPPFKELAQWHYQKAIANGAQRNADLEKMIEGKKPASATP